MKSAQKHLDKLVSLVEDVQGFFLQDGIDVDGKLQMFVVDLDSIIQRFSNISLDTYDIQTFINVNKANLFRIYDTLVGTFKNTYYKNTRHESKLRSCCDRLFRTILNIKQPKKRFASLPTDLSTEFCKGITYFKNETHGDDEQPFYHRDASCGSKRFTASEKFHQLHSNTNVDILRKKTYSRRCYLERLIYDVVYTNTFHHQDIGHLHELQIMERIHDCYFPSDCLNIHIDFVDGIIPAKLHIYITNKDIYIHEEYVKLKNENLQCKKLENGKVYTKIQGYSQETPWLPNV